MKIVEVIDGVRTEPWVGEALIALARRVGHAPVRAADTPGFIVNHAGRGYGTEALRIVAEGVRHVRRRSTASSRTAPAFAWGRSS